MYPLDQNNRAHSQHFHFYISSWPEYSFASSTPPPFLRIYLTRIFHRILDASISTYLLDQNIRLRPWYLHFYLSSGPEFSIASSTPHFLPINLTKIFFPTPDISISTYLLDQDIHSHPWHLHFYVSTRPKYSCPSLTPQCLRTYLTKIFLAHPRFPHFYVHIPAQPKYSCAHLIPPFLWIYSTIIFLLTLDSSISSNLLDHNILAHPRFLHFYVSTWP